MAGKKGKPGRVERAVAGAYSFIPSSTAQSWLTAYFRPQDCAGARPFLLGSAILNFAFAGFSAGVAGWLAALLSALFFGEAYGLIGGRIFGGAHLASLAVIAAALSFLYPLLWLALSGACFSAARLLGGSGSYAAQTWQLSQVLCGAVLIGMPFQLLSGLPLFGWIFGLFAAVVSLYALYGYYRVIKQVHHLPAFRAIVALALPVAALAFIVAALFAAALLYFMPAAGYTMKP